MEKAILYPELRDIIKSKYRTYANFADRMGIDASVLSRKLSGDLAITRKDITSWSDALEITREDYGVYFF